MRYLTLYTPAQRRLLVIDLSKPSREALIDGLYYTDKFDCFGYVSNHKHPLKAKYRRTQEGEIHYLDIPTRLDKLALMERLTAMRVRGEDKSPRKMHPNSLANLRPARPFTPTDRPNKPRKVTPQIREQVIQLREDGYSWRVIGDKVGLNVSTVRSVTIDTGQH
jgi:hypothetical protein